MANWVLGTGKHYWEVRILKCKMGMGVYLGMADSDIHPHLRGNGMSTATIPSKSCFEYSRGFAYHCGSGDLYNGGRVVHHTGVRARKNDVISMVYDGDDGTLSFYKNGSAIPGQHKGIHGHVSPVVDLSLGASVDLLRPGCYSSGQVCETDYAGTRKQQNVGDSLTTRDDPEVRFSEAVELRTNLVKLETTMEAHFADVEDETDHNLAYVIES